MHVATFISLNSCPVINIRPYKLDDAMSLFIDGEFQAISFGDANCINPPVSQDQGTLFLGKYFTGVMDDVLIYDRALSSEEIQQLFEWEPCCMN